MKTGPIAIAFLLLAGGLPLAQSRTDPKLNELAVQFAAAFNEKNAAKIAGFYTDDAVVMPPNMPMVQGRRDIEAYYKAGFSTNPGIMKLRPMESTVAGAIGFEAGSSTLSVGGPSGPTSGTSAGKYVVIYKRVNNEWKIAYDIFNNDTPPK